MNKKLILTAAILLQASLLMIAQPEKHHRHHKHQDDNCDTRVQKLDSLINYTFNSADSSFTPSYVIKYTINDEGQILGQKKINLPLRTPDYNQIFNYNEAGDIYAYLYQTWQDNSWVDTYRTDYSFDDDNNLIQEVKYKKDAQNNWVSYQIITYTYTDGVKTSFLRQDKDKNGNWSDTEHHYYIYDSAGNLTLLYGQYITTGEVYWKMNYYYYEDGKINYRTLEQLKYIPELKKNMLVNVNYQTYLYNIYGNLQELLTDEWINNEWVFTNKNVYYYSIIPNKKVVLCHNGHEICVSTNAVKAHLEHGDVLGKCPGSDDDNNCCRCNNRPDPPAPVCNQRDKGYSVYPMPFKSQIQIRITDQDKRYSTASLYTPGGSLVTTVKINGQTEITLNVPGLPDGPYLLKLSGDKIVSVSTVIKK